MRLGTWWRGARAGVLRPIFVIALATTIGAAAVQARPGGAKTLTVERIYSAPSLSGYLTEGIEWSPDSKRVSYFGQGRSGLEMWTTDAATGERKVLVKADVLAAAMPPEKTSAIQSTGLGRVQAENYQWSPAGDALLFIGGSRLVLLDLKTMASKALVTGANDVEDPKFSPDGKWVSFVRDANLYVVNAATAETRALTTGGSEEILKGQLDWLYPEELDVATAYWWSPDSSKIAYYEMDERPVTRYPDHGHEFVCRRDGVHALPAGGRGESDRARGRRAG